MFHNTILRSYYLYHSTSTSIASTREEIIKFLDAMPILFIGLTPGNIVSGQWLWMNASTVHDSWS